MDEILAREMYKEHILDLYKNPHNFGELKICKYECTNSNPLCGDEVKIQLNFKKNVVEDIKWKGNGCAISMASSSLLTDKVKGMTKEEIMKLKMDDVLEYMMIPISPVRLKCALLALETLQKAVHA